MFTKHNIFLAIATSVCSTIAWASPIFTVTPMSSSFSVTKGTTAEMQYDIRNVSGRSLTITNESVSQSSNVTSDAIAADSDCENSTLANNADCTLDIDVTGNSVGSDTVSPVVCAFNGQLCSTVAVGTSTTVVPQNTFNCATNSTTKECRVFTSEGTYKGDLSEGSGAVNTATCQSDASGVTKGNCICEKEAAAQGYGHPGHWRVWLSTETSGAISNIRYTSGGSLKYVRAGDTNTEVAAQGDLIGVNLTNSIKANGVGDFCVYTATQGSTGVIPGGGEKDCNGWTSTAAELGSVANGNAEGTNSIAVIGGWSRASNDECPGPLLCNKNLYLYCFEIPQ